MVQLAGIPCCGGEGDSCFDVPTCIFSLHRVFLGLPPAPVGAALSVVAVAGNVSHCAPLNVEAEGQSIPANSDSYSDVTALVAAALLHASTTPESRGVLTLEVTGLLSTGTRAGGGNDTHQGLVEPDGLGERGAGWTPERQPGAGRGLATAAADQPTVELLAQLADRAAAVSNCVAGQAGLGWALGPCRQLHACRAAEGGAGCEELDLTGLGISALASGMFNVSRVVFNVSRGEENGGVRGKFGLERPGSNASASPTAPTAPPAPAPVVPLTLPTQLLVLSGNPIAVLPARVFVSLPALTTLGAAGCAIVTVHEAAFDGLANLTRLDLSSNSIEMAMAEPSPFRDLSSLTVLDLRDNRIAGAVAPGSVVGPGLSVLQDLWLDGNRLTKISAGAFPLASLVLLGLSNNAIHSIEDGAFEGATGQCLGICSSLDE